MILVKGNYDNYTKLNQYDCCFMATPHVSIIFLLSYSRINSDWLWENHPPDTRFSTIIYVSDNVLTPEVIQAMYRHKKAIDSITTKYGDTWDTMCKKMPIVKAPDIAKIIGKGGGRGPLTIALLISLRQITFLAIPKTKMSGKKTMNGQTRMKI